MEDNLNIKLRRRFRSFSSF